MMNGIRFRGMFLWLVLLAAVAGCTQPAAPGNGELASVFDPADPREYGMRGAYLGQGIREAMEHLKPVRSEFMDAVTRESLTVEQLANGEGTVATGILLLESAQLVVRVKEGVVIGLMMGGAPESDGHLYRTNRGLALYDPVSRLNELYGEAAGQSERIYRSGNYQATFNVYQDKVIGFRFDLTPLQ